MGGSKSKTSSQQQSTTTTQLPAWMTQAGQDLYTKAAATPVVGAYGGQMAAGSSPNQSAASAAAASNAGAWQGDLDASRAMTTAAASAPAASVGAQDTRAATMRAANQGVAFAPDPAQATTTMAAMTPGATAQGYTAATVNGGAPTVTAGNVGTSTFDNAAATRYMNPYTQQVQADTLRTMDDQNAQDRATLDDSVAGAGAYGGTRQAVMDAALAKNQATARTNYIDQSNSDAYTNAQGQFNADRTANNAVSTGNADRQLQAGTTNATFLNDLLGRIDSASQFGANAANAASEANAGRTQATNLANAAASNATSEANAGRAQQTGLADQSAANTAMGANADRQQDASKTNAAAINTVANDNANRNLTASTTNANLYETMLDRLLKGGTQEGQTAEAVSNLGSKDISNLSATGAADQATQQNQLTDAYNEYLRAGNAPLDNIKDIMAILAGSPRNVTTTGNSSGTSTTTQSAGLFNQLMGVGSLAASAFSDRRLKTDVSWRHNLPNGLGVYHYRYLTDAPDAPIRTGVMADEVARIMPEALGPVVGGFATVDYSKVGDLNHVAR